MFLESNVTWLRDVVRRNVVSAKPISNHNDDVFRDSIKYEKSFVVNVSTL